MFGTILMQRVVSAALCAATLVGLPGCTALQTPEGARTRPVQTQAPERTPPDGITFGTQTRRGFVNDNVYHSHGGWSNELVNDLIPAWNRNTALGRRAPTRQALPFSGTTEGSADFPWVP